MLVTACVLAASIAVWAAGLLSIDPFDPQVRNEKRTASRLTRDHAPELEEQRLLALAYWKRYEDIRTNPHFGETGPAGIFGAWDHYRLHGKWEGRIYGPIPEITDEAAETVLAEAYWDRYPDVAKTVIWGRTSSLGLMGPRDHYRYVGKYEGRVWGVDAPDDKK